MQAEIFATASQRKHAVLREMGIKHVFDSRSADFAEQIKAATGGSGVDVIINTLPEAMFDANLSALSTRGVFVDLTKPATDLARHPVFAEGRTYHLFDLVNELRERPREVGRRLRSILSLVAKGTYEPLPLQVFPLRRAVDAFRQMQLAQQIGKLVIESDAAQRLEKSKPRDLQGVSIRSDAAYVIAGGLGDLGLLSARLLAESGAGLIALISRREVGERERRQIDRLERSGAKVIAYRGDITDANAVAEILQQVRDEGFPIAGIIHSAGVLSDALIQNQNESSLAKVFDVKASGAWNLHESTLKDPVEMFHVYSSLASVIGAPGQSNHSAANGFLDGLIEMRNAAGLPGTSINWGPWSKIGEAARRGADMRADLQGIGVIEPVAGANAMTALLHQPSQRIAVAKISSSALPARLKSKKLFDHLASDAGTSDGGDVKRFVHVVAAAEESERSALMIDYLRKSVADVLGMTDAKRLSASTVLTDVGLDSLTALELRDLLQSEFGAELPASLVYDYPSIGELSSFLLATVTSQLEFADASKSELEEVATDCGKSDKSHASSEELVDDDIQTSLDALNAELDLWET
ncbi:MAG: SDR family NAD(P)-dependent oxidoreductase [Pirellulaceae bacterium]